MARRSSNRSRPIARAWGLRGSGGVGMGFGFAVPVHGHHLPVLFQPDQPRVIPLDARPTGPAHPDDGAVHHELLLGGIDLHRHRVLFDEAARLGEDVGGDLPEHFELRGGVGQEAPDGQRPEDADLVPGVRDADGVTVLVDAGIAAQVDGTDGALGLSRGRGGGVGDRGGFGTPQRGLPLLGQKFLKADHSASSVTPWADCRGENNAHSTGHGKFTLFLTKVAMLRSGMPDPESPQGTRAQGGRWAVGWRVVCYRQTIGEH